MSALPELEPAQPRREPAVRRDFTGGLKVDTLAADATRASLQLHGEMDLSSAALLAAVLANQVQLGRRFIRLDVSGLNFVDCAGLREIVHAHNRCLAAHGTLVLTGVTPRFARLLTLTHFDEALFVAHGPDEPPRSQRPQRPQHLIAVSDQ